MVWRALEEPGGVEELIEPGSVVLIKPSVGFDNADAVASPEVVAAVMEAVSKAKPAKVIVAESAVRGYDTSRNFEVTGMGRAVREVGAELLDLDRVGEVVRVKVRNALAPRRVKVFKEVLEADYVISIPKLKRHAAATVTISLKNIMGAIPDDEKGAFHARGLHACIADLDAVLRPDLAIVDATKVMTVTGPRYGKIVPSNAIIAGVDPVAVDLVAAKYLFELEGAEDPAREALRVEHVRLAAKLA